jgi:hypothetical protein
MIKRLLGGWRGNGVIDDEEVVGGQTATNNSNKLGTETR